MSKTTIGIYARALRTLFNEADAEGIIQKANCYPFGRRKYIIPQGKNIKKAYTLNQIQQIFNYNPANEFEKRAQAYWKFFYLCNGINPKDAALLKFENIKEGYILFQRTKTIRTGRSDPKTISVYITKEIRKIIEILGNSDAHPDNYVFPILKPEMNLLNQHESIHLFIAFVNKWMGLIAKSIKLPRKPSTITSRHSFS